LDSNILAAAQSSSSEAAVMAERQHWPTPNGKQTLCKSLEQLTIEKQDFQRAHSKAQEAVKEAEARKKLAQQEIEHL